MTRLYAMNDAKPRGMVPVESMTRARQLNRDGFGVFATVNEFDGPRRIENLRRICAWAIDIDEGSKLEQRKRIEASPLIPSRVVETKNGYHVHWFAKDGKPEHWNAIVLERLVPHFGADRNARDMARVLRVPGFYHLKDPTTPFLVERVWAHDVAYTERQIAMMFPWVPSEQEQRRRQREDGNQIRREAASSADTSGDTFWARAIGLDCRHALERLSGHWLVGGERYRFRPVRTGNLNIEVDDGAGFKSTSCFLDEAGRIGSLSGGGPSVVRWLHWFGHSYRTIAKGLKEVFPELEGVK